MERSDQYRMRYQDQIVAMRNYYDNLELDRPLVYGEFNQPVGTNMPFVDLVQS
jgi:hypothetical protein